MQKRFILDLNRCTGCGACQLACSIENELDPFLNEIFRLIELGLQQESKLYCMGVLKGLYMYEHDSGSEFKDWATDMPGEYFRSVLDKWKKATKKKADIKEMDKFISIECENWAR